MNINKNQIENWSSSYLVLFIMFVDFFIEYIVPLNCVHYRLCGYNNLKT